MKLIGALLLVGVVACGSETTGPTTNYAPIAGSYVAPATGNATNGQPVNATVAMTVSQSSGMLNGTYTVTYSATPQNFVQSGSFTGVMSSADYPTVTLTLDREGCAGYTTQFTGTYDPGVKRMTLAGYVDVTSINMVSGACGVAQRLSTTLLLQR